MNNYKIFFYKRFLDDIFCVSHPSVDVKLDCSLAISNHLKFSVASKGTLETVTCFLDVSVVYREGAWVSYLYRKP